MDQHQVWKFRDTDSSQSLVQVTTVSLLSSARPRIVYQQAFSTNDFFYQAEWTVDIIWAVTIHYAVTCLLCGFLIHCWWSSIGGPFCWLALGQLPASLLKADRKLLIDMMKITEKQGHLNLLRFHAGSGDQPTTLGKCPAHNAWKWTCRRYTQQLPVYSWLLLQ